MYFREGSRTNPLFVETMITCIASVHKVLRGPSGELTPYVLSVARQVENIIIFLIEFSWVVLLLSIYVKSDTFQTEAKGITGKN